MIIWDYLKRFVFPSESAKPHLSWKPFFRIPRIGRPDEKQGPWIQPMKLTAKWFLQGHRMFQHKKYHLGGQAPRNTFSRNATPHR